MTLSTRLVTAMVALVVLSAAIIGAFTYRNIETGRDPALAGVDPVARPAAGARTRSLAARPVCRRGRLSFRGGGRGHRSRQPFRRRPGRHQPDAMARRLAARFVAELAVKPNYSQFRIIGVADGGREIIRVDRSGPGKTIRVVPDGELEQRGDSDYFQRAIRLGPNEVDVSPIELNQEQGVVELPHVPVIRTAAAIHTPDGRPFGIVVINVDLRRRIRPRPRGAPAGLADLRRQRARRLPASPGSEPRVRLRLRQAAASRRRFPRSRRGGDRGSAAPRIVRDRSGARVRRRACAGAARAGPRGGGRGSGPVCAGHRAGDRGAQLDPRSPVSPPSCSRSSWRSCWRAR